jgi:hypothetical protein
MARLRDGSQSPRPRRGRSICWLRILSQTRVRSTLLRRQSRRRGSLKAVCMPAHPHHASRRAALRGASALLWCLATLAHGAPAVVPGQLNALRVELPDEMRRMAGQGRMSSVRDAVVSWVIVAADPSPEVTQDEDVLALRFALDRVALAALKPLFAARAGGVCRNGIDASAAVIDLILRLGDRVGPWFIHVEDVQWCAMACGIGARRTVKRFNTDRHRECRGGCHELSNAVLCVMAGDGACRCACSTSPKPL